MLGNILETIEGNGSGIVLVEYSSFDHPELVFAELVKVWREKGVRPLIVDIGNTLHVFTTHLKLMGTSLKVYDLPVIKELGNAREGQIVGEVSEIEDFDYHMAKYGQVAKKVPKEIRRRTIVLGIEKFTLTFMDDPSKLEGYFERITRGYLKLPDRIGIYFLNVSVGSPYLIKSLEQDCDYVLRIERGVPKLVKSPGGGFVEVL